MMMMINNIDQDNDAAENNNDARKAYRITWEMCKLVIWEPESVIRRALS